MYPAPLVIDPDDPNAPRAPSQEEWDRLSEDERARVVESLPSEFSWTTPPEGDPHRLPQERARSTLEEYFRRVRRDVYLSGGLPVYYPDEPVFAPDLIAVLDVEPHERLRWVTSQEERGLDFALEIHVAGSAKKDFETNVVRFARLGIPEYFAFDPIRSRLLGWRLPHESAQTYEPIVPQEGRWRSQVLGLDLALEGGKLRFFHGSAPLLDARELIRSLSSMVDDSIRRAEEEARHAAEQTQRAAEQARRAAEEARRAEKLARRLRELGVDPDSIE